MLAENSQPSCSETILPEECLNLPSDCQAGVEDVLNRLQRMEEQVSWFQVRTLEEIKPLIPQTQKLAQDIFDGLRQYKNADNSWGAARHAALDLVWNAASGADRNAARDAAWDAARGADRNRVWDRAWDRAWNAASGVDRNAARARGAARHAAWDAALNAARGASWEIVKDLPGFETNPFAPFFSLYELGAGIEFHTVKETAGNEDPEEMLIVHFPLKLEDDRLVLACLAFPDGRTGDKTVQYTHLLQKDCSQIAPFLPIPQREIQ